MVFTAPKQVSHTLVRPLYALVRPLKDCLLWHCGLCCLLFLALLAVAGSAWAEPIPWTELETGLEYAEFDRQDESKSTIVLLRFAPTMFTFRLYSISEEGGPALTLRQWADKHPLVAAINASMYLPDGSTSTGYMRHHEHVNSKRVVGRFGAFFVAQLYQPAGSESPPVTLLDKDLDPWEAELPKYVSVVQNYRMINAQRRVLWSPGGPLYSISAVGKDGAGNILFIHCREPIEAHTFATLLLDLPIDVRTVMYVEGGAQAGLLVNTSKYTRSWAGRSPVDFLITGKLNAPLPNILGVVRGSQAAPQPSPSDTAAATDRARPEASAAPAVPVDSVVPAAPADSAIPAAPAAPVAPVEASAVSAAPAVSPQLATPAASGIPAAPAAPAPSQAPSAH